ncbi:MAG: PfkB family carbohydrate kinase [Geminicoccales bacterium]
MPAINLFSQRSRTFLVIGRAGMDFTPAVHGETALESASFSAGLGGSSANISAGLVKLGCAAAIMTPVSDDLIGRFCIHQLQRYGVDTGFVTMVGGEYRNSLAVYDRTETVIYRNGAADFQLTKADVEKPDYAAFAGLITTGTVLAGEPSRTSTFRAFDLAKEAGLPLIFDVDYRPYSWASAEEAAEVYSRAATYCDVIIGNDDEFGFMAGGYDLGLEKARTLVRSGASIVVYKQGEKGSITITEDNETECGIYPVEALAPNGAGDAFMGGLLSSLVQGLDLPTAVDRGSASAAITVSRAGCAEAIPTTDELNDFMDDRTNQR